MFIPAGWQDRGAKDLADGVVTRWAFATAGQWMWRSIWFQAKWVAWSRPCGVNAFRPRRGC